MQNFISNSATSRSSQAADSTLIFYNFKMGVGRKEAVKPANGEEAQLKYFTAERAALGASKSGAWIYTHVHKQLYFETMLFFLLIFLKL